MTSEQMKIMFQSAAEIARTVPELLQSTAFAKAVDLFVAERASLGGTAPFVPDRERSSVARKLRKSAGKPGPQAALEAMLFGTFFSAPKYPKEIQSQLKDAHGHDYSERELAISLLRLVRKRALARDKDEHGHYRYWTPSGESSAVLKEAL